jgi:hypothetical protein
MSSAEVSALNRWLSRFLKPAIRNGITELEIFHRRPRKTLVEPPISRNSCRRTAPSPAQNVAASVAMEGTIDTRGRSLDWGTGLRVIAPSILSIF